MRKTFSRSLLSLAIGLAFLSSAEAKTFSCECNNGTKCEVSCGSLGSISCGEKNCSSQCDASSNNGLQVASTLAASLAATRLGATDPAFRGGISFRQAGIRDLIRLLTQGEGLTAGTGPNEPIVIIGAKVDGVRQSILVPRFFYDNRRDLVQEIERNEPLIRNGMPPWIPQ